MSQLENSPQYITIADAMQLALDLFQSDGSYPERLLGSDIIYWEEPETQVDFTKMEYDSYRSLLVNSSHHVSYIVFQIAREPENTEYHLARLASYLAPYRHDKIFLSHLPQAVTLTIREHGGAKFEYVELDEIDALIAERGIRTPYTPGRSRRPPFWDSSSQEEDIIRQYKDIMERRREKSNQTS